MKRILLILCFLSTIQIASSQILHNVIKYSKDKYNQAQLTNNDKEAIKLSEEGIQELMKIIPYVSSIPECAYCCDPLVKLVRLQMDKIFKILDYTRKYDIEEYRRHVNAKHVRYKIDRNIEIFSIALEVDQKIKYLWGTFTVEDAFYYRGVAGFYFGASPIDYGNDLDNAGEKGKAFKRTISNYSRDNEKGSKRIIYR